MKNQYEPLVTPAGWTGDEKRFALRLTQILDELYERVGGVRKKLNASSVANALDVEDEGYVLDARQGKELADRIDRVASSRYEVGDLHLSFNDTDPAIRYGGVWERLEDVFLLAGGTMYAPGSTGGEAEVVLTEAQLAAHKHTGVVYRENQKAVSLNPGSGGYQLNWAADTGYGTESDLETGSAGAGEAHNNMPPYVAFYVWRRVE